MNDGGKKRHRGKPRIITILERTQPTEYEKRAATATPAELAAWVRANYRSYYVPEAVLDRMGLQCD